MLHLDPTTDESQRMAILSVWSEHGHRFIGTDSEEHESCLRCGALYALVPDAGDSTHGEYLTSRGGVPQECSGDTGRVHGYPGERVCDCEDGCEHCEHDCPCFLCDS